MDTLNPGTGSIVTEFMPATEPANVTTPPTGATTSVAGKVEKSMPQCPA
jgi:hypothetical protein